MEYDDNFYLRWNNYQATVMDVLNSLLVDETLVDITLASEGKWLRAHRLVLSAFSDYFKELLTIQPEKHPILYLRDVPFSHLEALITFMYRGEVDVPHKELPNFMKTANSLRIRGLADIHRYSRGSAAQTVEQSELASTSRTNVSPEASSPDKESTTSPESFPLSSTLSRRRPKRLRSASPDNIASRAIRKVDFHEKRIPVVKLTPIDGLTDIAHNVSEETKSSFLRSARHPSFRYISTYNSIAVTPSSSNETPMEFSPSSPEEENSYARLSRRDATLIEEPIGDEDSDTLALYTNYECEEEEWIDVETIGDSTGIGSQEVKNNGQIYSARGKSHKKSSKKQGLPDLKSRPYRVAGCYSCSRCSRSYKYRDGLDFHQRYACGSAAGQFKCTLCSYKGNYKANFVRHFRRHQKRAQIELYR